MGHTGSVKTISSHPTNHGTIMTHTHVGNVRFPPEKMIEISN